MAWLTTILEIQFAGAMLAVAADLGKRRLGPHRPTVIGGMTAILLAASIAELLGNWAAVLREGSITIQPLVSALATEYSVDKLGELVILTVLVVGLSVSVYTTLTFTPSDDAGLFYALLMLMVGSAIGVVSSGDFLTLFLFWEGLSVGAYGLVSFGRRDVSLEAALKYFFLAGSGALIYLLGVGVLFSATGSIRLSDLPLLVSSNEALGVISLIMILVGLGVEVAIFPAHTWLPDAYGATPAFTGGLNAMVVDGTLLFAMLKVVQPLVPSAGSALVRDVQVAFVVLAVLTMFVGNLGAFAQSNVRRMLGFSSIAQMGYMVAALSTFTPLGLVAVTFQLWNQGLAKSNFFLMTGVGGRREFEEAGFERLRGAGRQNPFLGVLFAASSLAMVGSPPFGMFWSEILIVESLLLVGNAAFFWVAVLVVLNIVISIGYYYKVINVVVFGTPLVQSPSEPTADMLPPFVLLLLSVGTFFVAALILGLL